MVNWASENRLKAISMILGIIISAVFIISFFPNPIETGAEKVYEQKKPEMIEAVDKRIQNHELRVEPRLQAIEIELESSKIRDEQMMVIQQEILTEVRK